MKEEDRLERTKKRELKGINRINNVNERGRE